MRSLTTWLLATRVMVNWGSQLGFFGKFMGFNVPVKFPTVTNVTLDVDANRTIGYIIMGTDFQPFVSDRYPLLGGPLEYTVDYTARDRAVGSSEDSIPRSYLDAVIEAGGLTNITYGSPRTVLSSLEDPSGAVFGRLYRPLLRGRYSFKDGNLLEITVRVTSTMRVFIRCRSPVGRRPVQFFRRFQLVPNPFAPNLFTLDGFDIRENPLVPERNGAFIFSATRDTLFVVLGDFIKGIKPLILTRT
ncbi:hypothetical protein FOZ63_002410 [Perkinsus olseni]|uniref:Uncharacterized protein n=1 Tax=Perkinsus olseni TaxID=32597 RepID=A0A7J6T536_PEROL|nr:hypothetical protein FOZ63_002410 [Perkinsus olseni]KAF4739566.1 hypothetical protein FOZ62_014181 [Perkinsus olseni]